MVKNGGIIQATFLNLHGRICAEGLLVFGIGGMAFVYVIAPLIDNWVKEHLNKKLSAACLVLLLFLVQMLFIRTLNLM